MRLITSSVFVSVFLVSSAALAQPFFIQPGQMEPYDLLQPVPRSQLTEIPDPESLGGTVLKGNPRAFIRVDYADANGVLAGVFEVTRGKIRIVFPFTEHATIISGAVRITDETGYTHTYLPGDSYVVLQGSTVIWETLGLSVQKSFLNYTAH